MKCKLSAKKPGMKSAGPVVQGDVISGFSIADVQDASFNVLGTNQAGDDIDISGIATLSACASDAPAILTVDTPVGMKSAMHALKVGSANISATATWTDGSVGPFTVTLPVTVVAGPANALKIVPGTPTVR
jgi:hypothetical protein